MKYWYKIQLQNTKSLHFICYKYKIELNHSDSWFLCCFMVTKEAQHQSPILIASLYYRMIKSTTNPWCLIGYIIYLIPLNYLSGLVFFLNLSVDSNRLCTLQYIFTGVSTATIPLFLLDNIFPSTLPSGFHSDPPFAWIKIKIRNHWSLQICVLVQCCGILRVISSCYEYFEKVEFWCKTRIIKKTSRTLKDHNLVPTVWFKRVATLCSRYTHPPTF